MQIKYSIYKPGGNDTALIFGIENDSSKRKLINDAIMKKHSNVEQVGFVTSDVKNPELMMAGGEFCGNATRSAAWQVFAGKAGEIAISVSGVKEKLRVGIDQKGYAWAQMPIYSDPSKITMLDDGTAMVVMEGITHVVVEDLNLNFSPKELKEYGFKVLQKFGLDKKIAASGVIFVSSADSGFTIRPVVWVRDVETLFYESACGSGTTAVGLLEAFKKKGPVELTIKQPSTMSITIKVSYAGKKFGEAILSGPMEVLTSQEVMTL